MRKRNTLRAGATAAEAAAAIPRGGRADYRRPAAAAARRAVYHVFLVRIESPQIGTFAATWLRHDSAAVHDHAVKAAVFASHLRVCDVDRFDPCDVFPPPRFDITFGDYLKRQNMLEPAPFDVRRSEIYHGASEDGCVAASTEAAGDACLDSERAEHDQDFARDAARSGSAHDRVVAAYVIALQTRTPAGNLIDVLM